MRLIAAAVTILCASAGRAQPQDCSIVREKDGTATVRGAVQRNDHSCVRDLACLLVLRCHGAVFPVYYSTAGDGPEERDAIRKAPPDGPALEGIATAGRTRAGELIEAHGQANEANGEIFGLRIFYAGCWLKVLSSEGAETVSAAPPDGPASGAVGALYRYQVSGASSLRHPLAFTIDWGDGHRSDLPAGKLADSHAWRAPGVYKVILHAVCEPDGVPEATSLALTVRIR